MVKTIISKNGYSIDKKEFSKKVISETKRDLMIEPFVERPEYGAPPPPIQIFHETPKRLYMPRFYGLNKFGPPEVNKMSDKNVAKNLERLEFSGDLLPRQKPLFPKILKQIQEVGGGCLSVYAGYGKTCMSIYLACALKVRTAIVCHTTDLMEQWKERIHQFAPKANIGIIQSKKCDIEDCDFVICSLGTVWRKNFDQDLSSIGLTIWDEIHLMCTQKFSQAFAKLATKYTFGLSATPYRKDKCDAIFQAYIGNVFHYEERDANPNVKAICIVHKMDPHIEYDFKNNISYVKTVVGLCMNDQRIQLIVDSLVEQLREDRNILVLSEYINHLKKLKKELKKNAEFIKLGKTVGLYIGEMKNDERAISRDTDVILGTYKIASVGMDIPKLNTLALASPRVDPNNLQQAFGRVLRDKKGEAANTHPVIIDFIDNHGIFINQGRKRKKLYKDNGYTIIQRNVKENGELISQRVLFDPNKQDEKSPKSSKSSGEGLKKFLITDEEQ